MADETDVASDVTEEATERAIFNIRQKVNDHAESNKFCVDCEEAIPEQRRQMVKGCKRCATCQDILEHKSRHYR